METLTLFKVEYDWYEGEHEEVLLAKNVDREQFKKDILESRDFARSLLGKECEMGEWLGKGYSVECLPEYYEQIIYFLEDVKGYVRTFYDDHYEYDVNDDMKISVTEIHTKKDRKTLGEEVQDEKSML